MEKPYDLKDLGEKLAASGLPIAKEALEAAAALTYSAVKQWVKESAALSENKVDDFAAAFIDQLDPIVLPQIDKIDGVLG